MQDLDYFTLLQNSEAKTTNEAFGISLERADEIEHLFAKGYNEYAKVMRQNKNLTKTDLFLFMSRVGFLAQTPQELIYMSLIVSERMTKNEIIGALSEVMPGDLVKKLLSALDNTTCTCERCRRKSENDEEDI